MIQTSRERNHEEKRSDNPCVIVLHFFFFFFFFFVIFPRDREVNYSSPDFLFVELFAVRLNIKKKMDLRRNTEKFDLFCQEASLLCESFLRHLVRHIKPGSYLLARKNSRCYSTARRLGVR